MRQQFFERKFLKFRNDGEKMKTELHYYDVFPKVIPADTESEITIKPLGAHTAFLPDYEYHIIISPLEFGTPYDYPETSLFEEYYIKPCADGCLRLRHRFVSEQQHFIKINLPEGSRDRQVRLSVYSVFPDLIGRYPFVGDLHMHTMRSDGRQSPAVVAANYRKHGYDFLAITDHRRYYPSLEAINAYKDVKTEFCLVTGEEVHMPKGDAKHKNDVHIVNFGGGYSVNALVEGSDHVNEVGGERELRSFYGVDCPDIISQDEFRAQVDALADTLCIPDGVSKFAYACCVWVFNHIKKSGGLGIFCHPYWISNVFQVPEALTDFMFEQKPFDAFEVLGGESYYEQNGFQAIKYYEQKAKGNTVPIVGSTDSHSSVNNANGFIASTVVFAPENTRESLISSIKDFYSVAVDTISDEFRMVGDLRLVKYATFLYQEFMPLHDELCFEEGRLMKDYACGDESAAAALAFIYGRMKKQREKYFKF